MPSLMRCVVLYLMALHTVISGDTDACFPPDSEFARIGCTCDSPGYLRCETRDVLTEFPVLNRSYPDVIEILAREQEFKELNRSHLQNFPNLEEINFNAGRISKISNDAFANNTRLLAILLQRNRLTDFPPVTNLAELKIMFLHENNIRSIEPGVLDGCYNIITLEAPDNDIRELKYGVFKDQHNLVNLNLNDNRRLSSIDDDVFENTRIQILRLENTEIDHLPSKGLRGTLVELFLAGTRNLKRFQAYESGREFYNQTYPYLRKAEFFYHAHCCQMADHHYYVPKTTSNSRSLDFGANRLSQPYDAMVEFKRDTMEIEDTAEEEYVCVNVTNGNLIVNTSGVTDLAQQVSASEFCSSELCHLTSICGENRCSPEMTATPFSSLVISDVYCIQIAPHACLDKFYSADNITSQIRRYDCNTSMGPSPTPTTPLPPTVSPCIDPIAWCTEVHPDDYDVCEFCVEFECEEEYCLEYFPGLACECERKKRHSTEQSHHLLQRSIESANTTSNCTLRVTEAICRVRLNSTEEDSLTPSPSISASHVTLTSIYTSPGSQTSLLAMPSPSPTIIPTTQDDTEACMYEGIDEIGELLLPLGWFYLDTDSRDTICSEVTMESSVQPIPTVAPTVNTGTPAITQAFTKGPLTECLPVPDDFNPCEDLLGDSDFLRAAIWCVIILAVLGNGIVIFVFVTYAVIIRRTKVRFFPMHFLYANLAMADFMMSIYLLTIASVDIRTKGEFSVHDVEWRTGPGCGFAGFCAITSTVVSVYTLVVITSERLYTITYVMHRRQITKVFVLVLMVFGWLFGILMGMLPLVGVSSYELVAICLPFDTGSTSALAYIVSLLLMTGLAFIYIAISYCIIFYQVQLSPTKRKLVRSGGHTKQWRADLRMSIRMFVLVVTNFLCWFPITLVSLTSAFGVPLRGIDVATAKIFVVFVFPLNACINPFLYTLSTRAFKQNLFAILGRCGLCQESSYSAVNSRMFGIPFTASTRTDISSSRRSSAISQLLTFNFTMFANRRASLASDNDSTSNNNLRRSSKDSNNDSLAGSQLMLHRSSAVSQSSTEDLLLAQVAPQVANHTPLPLLKDDKQRLRNNLNSVSSLGVLREVDEISDLPRTEPMVQLNPGYFEETSIDCNDTYTPVEHTCTPMCNKHDSSEETVVTESVSCPQHQVIANNILQLEGDSGEQSDTLSTAGDSRSNVSDHDPDILR